MANIKITDIMVFILDGNSEHLGHVGNIFQIRDWFLSKTNSLKQMK